MNRIKSHSFPYALLLAVALLLALFGQAVFGSTRLSLTTDEPMHIAMGYTVLTTGDYHLLPIHIHPPLVNAWAAWPLLLRPDRPDPRQVPGWDQANLWKFSAELIPRLGPVESVELATRVPIMLLALLLGAVVYRWASDLFGPRAGLLALFLFAFDPGIISSAQFNTTDMGALTFGMLSAYLAWHTTKRYTLVRVALVGLTLGMSIASKVSGLFFAPMLALLVGLTLLRDDWGKWNLFKLQALRWLARLLLIYALAFGIVWAAYRFELKPLPGTSFPIPATTHWLILQAFNRHVADGQSAFLAGQVSQFGWWWYFPLAFAIKTPVPSLVLLIVAAATWLRRRQSAWIDAAWLLLIPLVYFINAMLSTIDIGYRHLLPILPFIFVFIAVQVTSCRSQVSRATSWSHTLRFTFYALLAWYAISAALIFPHYQAYFNELAGGTDNGWRYLADSNTDWGQALKELAAYQNANGIEQVKLSMFTFIDPAWYGVRYEPLTPMRGNTAAVFSSRFNPPPGDYVISATTLDGIPLADPEMFDWFRQREPDARIGHVMFLYRVKPSATRTWVAQCTTPAAPLESQQMIEGFGRSDLRAAYFDCATSWLYPTGETSPGWVVLARDAPMWNTGWLSLARLSYEQKRSGFAPPFRIYEDEGRTTLAGGGQVRIAPTELSLAEASNGAAVDLPVALENGLTLVGYRLDRSSLKVGETAYLETVWRVESVPNRLLSIMAHVLAPDGSALAVGDGLGVPIESWQPGDVFIQRHALTIPKDAPPGSYWIQTGVYWIDDGVRWPVRDTRASGDRVLLTSVKVQ
jgi:hypothetical protein